MAKIDRKKANIFASGAETTAFTEFGTNITTKNIEAIQNTDVFNNQGWKGAVRINNGIEYAPTLQDFNSLHYVHSYFNGYLLQQGIAEWYATETYYIGSIAKYNNILYISITDANTNNIPDSDISGTNWKIYDLKNKIYQDIGLANVYVINQNNLYYKLPLKDKMEYWFIPLHTNTGSSTLTIDGHPPLDIKRINNTDLQDRDITQNYLCKVYYDLTFNCFILNHDSILNSNKLIANTIESPSLYNANILDNGNCYINQRAAIFTVINNTYGFTVDRWACKVSATTSASGTIAQIDSAIKNNGKAIKFTTITTTGATGTSNIRQRICGQDAVLYKNQYLSFQALIKHDIGVSIPFTVYIRKATVYNDFTTTTEISNSGAINITTETITTLKYENFNVGDCSNGLEIEIIANHGSITNKNIEITNLKLEQGNKITNFRDDSYINNLNKCLSYYQEISFTFDMKARDGNSAGQGFGYVLNIPFFYPVFFIKTPSIISYTHSITIFTGTAPGYIATTSISTPTSTTKQLNMNFQPVNNNVNFSTYGGNCAFSGKISAEL